MKFFKKVKKVLSNKNELWRWISWTFFKKEFMDHNKSMIVENLDFGKLLHRKETLRALQILRKEYEQVIHGHVALSVIDEMIEITKRS